MIIKKVWIAEWSDHDSYARMGLFNTQYDAFIACLKDYKKNKDFHMPYIKKKDFSNWQWHRNDIIKNLRRYQIYQEEIR